MFKHRDLPETLAVFPLPGALLLPRGRLPLHIFEPRYLQMLEDALKTPHRLIGMVQPMSSSEDGEVLHQVGCAGRVTGFQETEDGRYLITLTGISRFRLGEEVEGFTPYRRFKALWDSYPRDIGAAETDPGFDRETFMDSLDRFFRDRGLSTDWDTLQEAEDELLINSLSMLVPFTPEDKQALLEAPTLPARRATLVTLIDFALRGGQDDEVMQ